MRTRSVLATLTLLCALVPPVAGQEVSGRGGRDLSGVWMARDPGPTFSAAEPRMTPWAAERFDRTRPTLGPRVSLDSNDPTVTCFPPGVPYVLTVPVPFEFVESGNRLTQLFEYNHTVRRIYMDGRPHPADLADTESAQWMGHSIGRWEDETLVIDTVGFNDRTWLDRLGHPHSTALHVVERIRRLDTSTLQYEVAIDDPVAYETVWGGRLIFVRRPGWEILEHHCMPEDGEYARYRERAWAQRP